MSKKKSLGQIKEEQYLDIIARMEEIYFNEANISKFERDNQLSCELEIAKRIHEAQSYEQIQQILKIWR